MLLKAASELGLDLSSSFMVGDKTLDVLAGRNAGTREAILVRTGHGREAERELPPGAAVADDFPAAAALILAELKRGATKRV
jgi:D-glycero-D-manno-heptose 1,7-bisphosphate phosphatase